MHFAVHGRCVKPIVREGNHGVSELRRVGSEPVVGRVRPIPGGHVTGGEVRGGQFTPAVGQAPIEGNGTKQRHSRSSAATGGGAGASEFELQDRGVRVHFTQTLKHGHRGPRVSQLAARGCEQQLRLRVLRCLGDDLRSPSRGTRRIGIEQRGRTHQCEIDRSRSAQEPLPANDKGRPRRPPRP
jgi:hypothetical protein